MTAAGSARAHLTVVGGRAPFLDGGALVGGSTSWGIVVIDDDGSPRRVCEEAAGPGVALHLWLPGGRVVVATPTGLLRSDDKGCTYQSPGTPVSGVEITALAHGPSGLFVTTGRTGFPNGVFRSDDNGSSFAATALTGSASPLYSAAVDPLSGRVVVAGDDIDLESPMAFQSSDGGTSWTRATFDMSPWLGVRISGFDDAGNALFAATRSDGRGDVIIAAPGLATARQLGPLPGAVTHAAQHGENVYAVVSPGALYVSPGNASAFAPTGVDAECIQTVSGVLWACGSTTGPLAGVHFASSLDGVAWQSELRDDAISERQCPAGTIGQSACAAYANPDAGILIGDDAGPVPLADAGPTAAVDGGPAPPDDVTSLPSGCAAAGPTALGLSGLWLCLLAGVPAGRRRFQQRAGRGIRGP